jgi:uncharacterized protein YecA (UPF0149 family)
MPWGRGGLKGLVGKSAAKLSKGIDKEDFLTQLEEAWRPYVKRDSDIEQELVRARERINSSGAFKSAFENVGVTDDDLRQVLQNIKDAKPEQYVREAPKIGRNEPCPCGSGKKYKHCCGG